MPTVDKKDLTKIEREKIVKELYPIFESNVLVDIVEYGRTIKSLKPDESLTFKVTLTKCEGCRIPSTVDYSIKQSVLSDYASGKLSKDAALKKITIIKGPNQ